MPIALVPDGFTLKKVTKLQLEAIKDYRKHEDFKAFLSSSGSGKGLGLGALGITKTKRRKERPRFSNRRKRPISGN